MPFDVAAVQQSLKAEGLDGWLLYDFHGSNPIAARLLGTANGAKMTTRRWFYLVPATGEPRGLVHAIERRTLDALPGEKAVYAGRQQLDAGLTKLLSGVKRVAMEYSRNCAIPYISRIDGGTLELVRAPRRRSGVVRRSGAAVRSGVGRTRARDAPRRVAGALSDEGSRVRADRETRARRRGDDGVRGSAADGGVVRRRRARQRLAPGCGGAGERGRSALPAHRAAHAGRFGRTNWCCSICGRKRKTTRTRCSPISHGSGSPAETCRRRWRRRSRPSARRATRPSASCRSRPGNNTICADGRSTARRVTCLQSAGFGERILHRTGHSLGRDVHGNGVHMDDYETHDDRRLIPGTGFTIEPGLYFESFGVRTEINMYYGERDALVTGPVQTEIVRL